MSETAPSDGLRTRAASDVSPEQEVRRRGAVGQANGLTDGTAAVDAARLGGRPLVVAIDGPAGAGKSTLAKRLAERFGLLNLETGAMYRAFALKTLDQGLGTGDAAGLEALAAETTIKLEPGTGGNRVVLDGQDVTARLRTPEVTAAASEVSVHPAIRRWMVGLQRLLGVRGNVVMEGRDIGTEVFPDASVKIFLDASPEKRGERRFDQVSGGAADAPVPEAVLRDMRERDQRDRMRANSPLRPAEDAVLIDSTEMPLEEVVERAAALVEARIRFRGSAEQGITER